MSETIVAPGSKPGLPLAPPPSSFERAGRLIRGPQERLQIFRDLDDPAGAGLRRNGPDNDFLLLNIFPTQAPDFAPADSGEGGNRIQRAHLLVGGPQEPLSLVRGEDGDFLFVLVDIVRSAIAGPA